jgi:hypothetical protein
MHYSELEVESCEGSDNALKDMNEESPHFQRTILFASSHFGISRV